MATNRYNIVKFAQLGRNLERVDIRIVKYDLKLQVDHWNLNNRLSRFWLVYWNDTAGATLEFQNFSVDMAPGKMILIAPYTLVTAHTLKPFIHNFVEFDADNPFKMVKCAPLVFPAAEFAPELPAQSTAVQKSLGLYAMVEHLLLQISQKEHPQQKQDIFDPRIQAALKYMDDHFMKKYSVSELCRHINLSKPRFLHLFKDETGFTPRDYWLKQRLDLVLRMLEDTDLSIPEIAEEAGFTDRSHLSRVIKARFGLTPAAIIKKMTAVRKNEKESQGEK